MIRDDENLLIESSTWQKFVHNNPIARYLIIVAMSVSIDNIWDQFNLFPVHKSSWSAFKSVDFAILFQ